MRLSTCKHASGPRRPVSLEQPRSQGQSWEKPKVRSCRLFCKLFPYTCTYVHATGHVCMSCKLHKIQDRLKSYHRGACRTHNMIKSQSGKKCQLPSSLSLSTGQRWFPPSGLLLAIYHAHAPVLQRCNVASHADKDLSWMQALLVDG